MQKKAKIDFSVGITASADDEVIDKEVDKKLRKFVKDLKELGVEVQTAFISSGHIRGGSFDLIEEEAKADGDKK